MKLIRRVREGEMLHSLWWGYCWHEWDRRYNVCAPIGLNVLFAASRWAYLWLRYRIADWLHRHEPPKFAE